MFRNSGRRLPARPRRGDGAARARKARRAGGFFLAAIIALPAAAAPKAELWERWAAHGARSEPIDHAAWNDFTGRYVQPAADGINRLAYARVRAADRAALADYVGRLEALPVTQYVRAEQRAYWINLYNALTVKLVLEHYPVRSILKIDISPGLFARGPWGARLATVEGEKLSLDDIEHRILRPIWKDPRTHYALNCASLGCPNLQPAAYTAAHLERMLDAGARAYVNHPRGARVEDGKLRVSSIYVWFAADFGGDDAGVIAHLKRYAEPRLARELDGVRRIATHDYDWALNDAR